jgi:hypothetical protein
MSENVIGLRPRWLLDKERRAEIIAAMQRYEDCCKEVPFEWVVELLEIVDRLKDHNLKMLREEREVEE